MKNFFYVFLLLLTSTVIHAQRYSYEVKYFVNHLEEIVNLTAEQKASLYEMATENEMKKLFFQRQLKQLKASEQKKPGEIKAVRRQIKERTIEEGENLKKLLNQEQYKLYLKDKSKRKFENQTKDLTTLLSLTAEQQPAVLELVSENGLKQDSIKREVMAAKASKDNKAIMGLKNAQVSLKTTFDASLGKLLTLEQVAIYSKNQIEKNLKSKLKKFQSDQKVTDAALTKIKDLMVEYQYKKSNDTSTISESEMKMLNATLQAKLQNLLTTVQFTEYQKKFAKMM